MPPTYVVPYFCDVLVELSVYFQGESHEWLRQALTQVPITVLTDESKENFIELL